MKFFYKYKTVRKGLVFCLVLCIVIIILVCYYLQTQDDYVEKKWVHMDISTIIMGGEHIGILDKKSDYYSYGYNLYGQTGIDQNTITDISKTKIPYIKSPQKVDNNVMQAANGEWHTLILDNKRNLYSVGNNRYGQLGNREISSISPVMPDAKSSEVILLETAKKVKKIEANWMQSAYITMDGDLFVWGNNEFGNLGTEKIGDLDEETRDCIIENPTKVFENVDDVSFGKEHTLILTKNSDVFSTGSNVFFQLGKKGVTYQKSFQKILSGVRSIECSFRTSYAIDNKNNLWAWGDNRFGQISKNGHKKIDTPFMMETNVREIKAGVNHVVILLNDGTCYVMGANDSAQTGGVTKDNPLEDVEEIYTGDNTTIIKRSDNSYWGWGDNKYRIVSNQNIDFIKEPTKIK